MQKMSQTGNDLMHARGPLRLTERQSEVIHGPCQLI